MDDEIKYHSAPLSNSKTVKPYFQSIEENSRYFFIANSLCDETLFRFDTQTLVVEKFGKFPIKHRIEMSWTNYEDQWIYLSLESKDYFSLIYTFGQVNL